MHGPYAFLISSLLSWAIDYDAVRLCILFRSMEWCPTGIELGP